MRRQMPEIRDLQKLVPDLGAEGLYLLMGTPQEFVEKPQFVHYFECRGVDRIAAEITQEIGMFLEDENRNPSPCQQKSQHHAGGAATRDAAADRNLGRIHRSPPGPAPPTPPERSDGGGNSRLDGWQGRKIDYVLGSFQFFEACGFLCGHVVAVCGAVRFGDGCLGRNGT